MMQRRLRAWTWFLLVALLLLAGCGRPAPATPPAPGPQTPSPAPTTPPPGPPLPEELIIGTFADHRSISSIYHSGQIAWRTTLLYDRLIDRDPLTGLTQPRSAESWQISGDGLTYTFKLRKDMKWHDGQPVTAHDFAFAIQQILQPHYIGIWQQHYRILKGAEKVIAGEADQLEGLQVPDDHTLVLALNEPSAPFMLLSLYQLKPLPLHLLKDEHLTPEHPYNRAPVGTGPYVFKEWVANDRFVVVAFEDHWEGVPLIKTMREIIAPDMNALLVAMEAGDVHMTITIPPAEMPRLMNHPTLALHWLPSSTMEALNFNLKHPILSDVRVRRAIAHALDMDTFCATVLQGTAQPATSAIISASWAHNPNVRQPEYDLDKAKALLAQAGYPQGFKITVETNAGNIFREQFANVVQAQLAKIGITVEVALSEWATFRTRVTNREPEMWILNSGAGEPDPAALAFEFHSAGVDNAVSFSNAEVDRLLDEAAKLSDVEQRRARYLRVQEIIADEIPRYFGFYRPSPVLLDKRIKGFVPSILGGFENIQHLYWGH